MVPTCPIQVIYGTNLPYAGQTVPTCPIKVVYGTNLPHLGYIVPTCPIKVIYGTNLPHSGYIVIIKFRDVWPTPEPLLAVLYILGTTKGVWGCFALYICIKYMTLWCKHTLYLLYIVHYICKKRLPKLNYILWTVLILFLIGDSNHHHRGPPYSCPPEPQSNQTIFKPFNHKGSSLIWGF